MPHGPSLCDNRGLAPRIVATSRPRSGHRCAYIEATIDDVALANELAAAVFARSLDELPPQTRTLLAHIRGLAPEPADAGASGGAASLPPGPSRPSTFSRRELREKCGWSLTQVSLRLDRLVALEYLAVRCGRMGSQFVYELLVTDEQPFAVPLIDVAALKKYRYRANPTGQRPNLTGGDGMGPIGDNAA